MASNANNDDLVRITDKVGLIAHGLDVLKADGGRFVSQSIMDAPLWLGALQDDDVDGIDIDPDDVKYHTSVGVAKVKVGPDVGRYAITVRYAIADKPFALFGGFEDTRKRAVDIGEQISGCLGMIGAEGTINPFMTGGSHNSFDVKARLGTHATEEGRARLAKSVQLCHACEKGGSAGDGDAVKMQRCAACKAVLYCSRECQRADWPKHKARCKALRQARKGARDKQAQVRSTAKKEDRTQLNQGKPAAGGGGGGSPSPAAAAQAARRATEVLAVMRRSYQAIPTIGAAVEALNAFDDDAVYQAAHDQGLCDLLRAMIEEDAAQLERSEGPIFEGVLNCWSHHVHCTLMSFGLRRVGTKFRGMNTGRALQLLVGAGAWPAVLRVVKALVERAVDARVPPELRQYLNHVARDHLRAYTAALIDPALAVPLLERWQGEIVATLGPLIRTLDKAGDLDPASAMEGMAQKFAAFFVVHAKKTGRDWEALQRAYRIPQQAFVMFAMVSVPLAAKEVEEQRQLSVAESNAVARQSMASMGMGRSGRKKGKGGKKGRRRR